ARRYTGFSLHTLMLLDSDAAHAQRDIAGWGVLGLSLSPSAGSAGALGAQASRQAARQVATNGGLSRFVASHVDAFIDRTVDAWSAAGKNKTFVIGEGQKRIGKHIREHLSGDALEFRKVWPNNMKFKLGDNGLLSAVDEATLIDFNRHLIRRLYEKGFRFIDIGRDGREVGSKFYEAELQVLRELGVFN
ncbi:MAG: hypothetical protein ABL921_32325, partial [Pirellula sp.]